ncbi:MAG: methylated-DNA--[Paludibacteraceae bacterium]|nr:methylated-DNA--[protein]-cysteine S-methyltransferase [Paludibacteraceae bacterium]
MNTIYAATYSSPLGTIVLESDGECLTSLRFVDGTDNIVSASPVESAATFGCTTVSTPHISVISQTLQWLDDYFAGKQPRNIPLLNPHGTTFQRRVWQALFTIPYARTKTYADIARLVGCRSAQAIGQALTRNPIALIIPCHRVICTNGSLGGYAYGSNRKKRLLELETLASS